MRKLLLAFILLYLDINTKEWAVEYLCGVKHLGTIGGIDLYLHLVANHGIAWGIGSSWGAAWQQFLIVARIGVVAYLLAFMRIASPQIMRYAVWLMMVGGLGNVIDYFRYGHVVDMIHCLLWGYSFPVFNIADMSICVGVGLWVLAHLRRRSQAAR